MNLSSLKKDICAINQGHFNAWGINWIFRKDGPDVFNKDLFTTLSEVFDHPRLDIKKEDLIDMQRNFEWFGKPEDEIVKIVADVLRHHRPSLMERYDQRESLSEGEREALKEDIYRIKNGHFRQWGIISGVVTHYDADYRNALMSVFKDLDLDDLGFGLKYETKSDAMRSIRYQLAKMNPSLLWRYDNLSTLDADQVKFLKREIYNISTVHLNAWGLHRLGSHRWLYKGNYARALIDFFEKLDLYEIGFLKRGFNKKRALEKITFMLCLEYPEMMNDYYNLGSLSEKEKSLLREKVYDIESVQFSQWDILVTLRFFDNSYKNALLAVFNDDDSSANIQIRIQEDNMLLRKATDASTPIIKSVADVGVQSPLQLHEMKKDFLGSVDYQGREKEKSLGRGISVTFIPEDCSPKSLETVIFDNIMGLLQIAVENEYDADRGFFPEVGKQMVSQETFNAVIEDKIKSLIVVVAQVDKLHNEDRQTIQIVDPHDVAELIFLHGIALEAIHSVIVPARYSALVREVFPKTVNIVEIPKEKNITCDIQVRGKFVKGNISLWVTRKASVTIPDFLSTLADFIGNNQKQAWIIHGVRNYAPSDFIDDLPREGTMITPETSMIDIMRMNDEEDGNENIAMSLMFITDA